MRRPASASRGRDPGALVWASSSTSTTSGWRASTASRSISSSLRPAVRHGAARDDLEVAELLGGPFPAVGLDVADDDVGAPLGPSPALAQHGEGLADARARRRGRCAGGRGSRAESTEHPHRGAASWSRVEVEEHHVHARRRRARRGDGPRCARRPGRAPSSTGRSRASATRGAWRRALATEMCGSSPEAEPVTASTGTADLGREAVRLAVGGDPLLDGGEQLGAASGPGWSRSWRPRRSRRPRRGRSGLEPLRALEALAEELGADRDAVDLDERPVGLVRGTRPGRRR